MKKVLTIGSATQDIFIRYPDPKTVELPLRGKIEPFLVLPEGEKIEVQHLDYHTGGGATNSATSFSRLNIPAACCIKIGNDDQGRHITSQLATAHIKTYASIDQTLATGTSFILPTESHDRVALVWRGANIHLQPQDIPQHAIESSDYIYITSLAGPASQSLALITQQAKTLGKKVATNPGTSQLTADAHSLIRSLQHIDVLIMNSCEACLCLKALVQQHALTKSADYTPHTTAHSPALIAQPFIHDNTPYRLQELCATLLNYGPSIVVITNGAEGVYVATNNSLLFHPSLPTKIVNTLGAGDAFGSCFVASIMHNKNIKDAMLCGLLNAQSVIEHLDAKSGLLTAHELETKYQALAASTAPTFQSFSLSAL